MIVEENDKKRKDLFLAKQQFGHYEMPGQDVIGRFSAKKGEK
jgi:hypothetical protein